MQKDHFHKFAKAWKGKGSYILLGLCVVAVAVSGYFFLDGAKQEQAALSVPVTVVEPEKKPQAKPAPAQPTKPVSAPAEEISEPVRVLPVSGQITRPYAADCLTYHATTKDWRVHKGVDLAAEAGTAVLAAGAGTVTAAYEDESYGTTVVILHEDGYTTHTGNLEEVLPVAVGDKVAAGDIIGTVGATALQETAEPSHVHFEVYQNETPVDPVTFLRDNG
jgi:murein DD-endopeptidase MepM/ murein hydrolase activator NlpD